MNSSSIGLPQPQPFSGSNTCSNVESSMGCKQNVSPLEISEDCTDSACHLAMGWNEMAALDFLTPSSCIWVSVCGCLSLSIIPITKKEATPKTKGPCSTGFPSSICLFAEVLIGSALAGGGANLQPRKLSWSFLQRPCQQPPPQLPNPARHKHGTFRKKTWWVYLRIWIDS